MMKHGLWIPALLCWAATAAFAAQGSPGGPQALSPQELEAVEGGDLYLGVDRNRQMMTVTQVTPGQYYGSQSYSVKVTTSVVQNKEVNSQLVKGDMTNATRQLGTTATTKTGEKLYQLPVQYPSGTYKVSSQPTTLPNVLGPAIRTSASQNVPVVNSGGTFFGMVMDYGYFIHYANPAVTTNTLGCIGVQSLDSMVKLADTLKVDNASYPKGAVPNQTVSVTSYTNATPPPSTAFTPAGVAAAPTTTSGSAPSKTATSTSSSSSSSGGSSATTATKSPAATTPTPSAPTPVAPTPVAQAPEASVPTVSTPPPSVPVVRAPTTKTAKLKDL